MLNMAPVAPAAVRSVDRAVDLLESLASHGCPLSLARLTELLGVPKSTVLNIVRTLAHRRMVEYDAASRTYRLGWRLTELASRVGSSTDVRAVAKAHLDQLAAATQEAVFLSALDGAEVVFLEKIDSAQPIRYIAQVGTRRPLHCTASGKLFLAWQSPEQAQAYVREVGLARYTSSTITAPRRLQAELRRIRRQGLAVSRGEFLPDLMGLAAPVLRPGGQELAAAVLIAGPAFRVRRQARALVPLLRRAAELISADLAMPRLAGGAAARRRSAITTKGVLA